MFINYVYYIFFRIAIFFLELHIDNVTQTNKTPPAENKVLEELPQDNSPKVLQITEKNQEAVEKEEIISAINEQQVYNKYATISHIEIFVLHLLQVLLLISFSTK